LSKNETERAIESLDVATDAIHSLGFNGFLKTVIVTGSPEATIRVLEETATKKDNELLDRLSTPGPSEPPVEAPPSLTPADLSALVGKVSATTMLYIDVRNRERHLVINFRGWKDWEGISPPDQIKAELLQGMIDRMRREKTARIRTDLWKAGLLSRKARDPQVVNAAVEVLNESIVEAYRYRYNLLPKRAPADHDCVPILAVILGAKRGLRQLSRNRDDLVVRALRLYHPVRDMLISATGHAFAAPNLPQPPNVTEVLEAAKLNREMAPLADSLQEMLDRLPNCSPANPCEYTAQDFVRFYKLIVAPRRFLPIWRDHLVIYH
jgi:hypothetical protein